MSHQEILMDSPIGEIRLVSEDGKALVGVFMEEHRNEVPPDALPGEAVTVLQEARRQLEEYFAGERTTFDVPLLMQGTPFQRRVWEALRTVPFGETRSYGDIARQTGRPTAVRAVGRANGRNPIAILVPCHRVIGADGSLTGFGGGLPRKQWLLQHEEAVARRWGNRQEVSFEAEGRGESGE